MRKGTNSVRCNNYTAVQPIVLREYFSLDESGLSLLVDAPYNVLRSMITFTEICWER